MKRFRIIIPAITCFICAATAAPAQSVLNLPSLISILKNPLTIVQSITGTDGSKASLVKVGGSSIDFFFSCTSPDGKTTISNQAQSPTGASVNTILVGCGSGIVGLIVINPTTAAVTMGSLGTAPINGITWQFTDGDNTTILSPTTAPVWP